MTPYQQHEKLHHKMSRSSPNGLDIIEECEECPARFLHTRTVDYPITLRGTDEAKQP